MKPAQIAAQLYTVRDHCRTASDFAASMARIRIIGYTAVQVSGVGPIPAAEIRKICDDNGLTICATHEPGKDIIDEPARVVERLSILGATHTAYPYPHVALDSAEAIGALVKGLDRSGAVLAKAGKVLSYHNHAIEFRRFGGRTILEIIYGETNPAHLQAEPDVFWIQAGGGDPVAWCRRLKGRLPVIHLKDYAVGPDDRPLTAEVGNGNLSWAAIIPAAEAAGCAWFVVEQDNCPADPFDSLQFSFRYLSRMIHEATGLLAPAASAGR